MSTELLVKVPWTDVVIVVSKLIKFSKSGISKDEGKELVSLLAVLGAQIAGAVGPELTDDEPVSKPPKRKK